MPIIITKNGIVLALVDQAGRDEVIARGEADSPFKAMAADKRRIAAYVADRATQDFFWLGE